MEKKLIVLGCLGIAVTVGLYSLFYYKGFVERGGVYDELRGHMAQTMLNDLVKNIEYYKVVNGRYPVKLEDLEASLNQNSFIRIYDPTNVAEQGKKFFYKLNDNKETYYLLSVGMDQKPFTSDDIVPSVLESEQHKIGLLVHQASVTDNKESGQE